MLDASFELVSLCGIAILRGAEEGGTLGLPQLPDVRDHRANFVV